MGKLIFIGLGLGDEKGMTLRGFKAAEACDTLFVESYTSSMERHAIDKLAHTLDKDIVVLSREDVEGSEDILQKAETSTVGLLVPGDPMSATTHVDLRLRAVAVGIETKVIGGVSALTTVPACLGLQIYNFGRTVTIPLPQQRFRPTSFYERALENFERGMHSLLLLDIQKEDGRYMTANQGFDVLARVEDELQGGLLDPERLVCVVARVGSDDTVAMAGYFPDIRDRDFGQPLHSIVIPGKLHFMEARALVEFAGAPTDILG